MSVDFFAAPVSAVRLRVGPLAPYIDAFAADRRDKGYRKAAAVFHLRTVAALSRWLERHALGAADLTAARTRRFLATPEVRRLHGHPIAVRDLTEQLRRDGVLSPTAADTRPDDPISRVTMAFEEHLVRERGLAASTVSHHVDAMRRFLVRRFGRSGSVSVSAICPRDVTRFQLRHARRGRARAKKQAMALRAFLRFLRLRGDIDADLAACVLPVAEWRLAGLPRWIAPERVRRILDACDRSTSKGRRDYAILLVLARLGLRAGEIVALRLDDVRWEAGEIVVHGKGARIDRLPLPHDVGAALAAYIRDARPRSTAREIFLRVRAPWRGLMCGAVVSTLVTRAIKRARLQRLPRKGAHTLRHSLATHMLSKGASLAEIGEVLRHASTQSTAIYAKVDLVGLRSIARRWHGGGR